MGLSQRTRAQIAVLTLTALAPAAHAQIPLFRSYASTSIVTREDIGGWQLREEAFRGAFYTPSAIPLNAFLNQATSNYTGGAGGASIRFTGTGAANYRGFYADGLHVDGTLTNVAAPSDFAVDGAAPPKGYLVTAGFSSLTTVQFNSPSVISDGSAVFHWKVSGSQSVDGGFIASYLGFGAGSGLTLNDSWDGSKVAQLAGTGDLQYNLPLNLGQTQTLLFHNQLQWIVSPDNLRNLGGKTNLSANADYMGTYVLDRVELLDSGGSPVPEWSMVDPDTGTVVFNQDGRQSPLLGAAAPEPATLALLPLGLAALALVRRRRTPIPRPLPSASEGRGV